MRWKCEKRISDAFFKTLKGEIIIPVPVTITAIAVSLD